MTDLFYARSKDLLYKGSKVLVCPLMYMVPDEEPHRLIAACQADLMVVLGPAAPATS